MDTAHYTSALENPYVAILVGAAVSLDVVALTFCSSRIYTSGPQTWLRWAKYNASWHAGLLLIYLILIDSLSVSAQYVGYILQLDLPSWLEFLRPFWTWLSEKFRMHAIVYAALIAMAWVWRQYCTKVVSVPNAPSIEEAPFFLRGMFRRSKPDISSQDSPWFWHLSACLVAVDMLALAAVIKSGEKIIQFPKGYDHFEGSLSDVNEKIVSSFNQSFLVGSFITTVAVFIIVGLLCYASAYISKNFWKNLRESGDQKNLMAVFIVVALRLLEPLVIFYFIIHSMAFLATGVPVHNPAFLLGSGFLMAALIQYVGFEHIIEASQAQVELAVARPLKPA